MKRAVGRHWETLALLAVAVLCAFSIPALSDPGTASSSALRRSIAGLTGPAVERAVAAISPTADSDVSVISGRRSIAYSIDVPGGAAGSITVSSLTGDGTVTRVACDAYSTPSRPLTVAGNAVLRFCATLPATGAGTGTVAWIDQQFGAASVGYSTAQNHSGIQYDLSYSQYSNDRTHYAITVLPAVRS